MTLLSPAMNMPALQEACEYAHTASANLQNLDPPIDPSPSVPGGLEVPVARARLSGSGVRSNATKRSSHVRCARGAEHSSCSQAPDLGSAEITSVCPLIAPISADAHDVSSSTPKPCQRVHEFHLFQRLSKSPANFTSRPSTQSSARIVKSPLKATRTSQHRNARESLTACSE